MKHKYNMRPNVGHNTDQTKSGCFDNIDATCRSCYDIQIDVRGVDTYVGVATFCRMCYMS